jgi:hypothetical protein
MRTSPFQERSSTHGTQRGPGALTVEPDPSTAVFAFSKTFGQKNGLGDSIHCTFVDTETDETGTTFTAFGDVDVFLQR